MTIVLVGLNYRTTPVELREQFSLAGCGLQMALKTLQAYRRQPQKPSTTQQSTPPPDEVALLNEAVILSTCNRLEIYAVAAGKASRGWRALEDYLITLQGIASDQLRPHLYFMENQEAVTHLMRVACGLDSLVLGETQILGQVAQAFNDAQGVGTTGPILSHLFAQAVHAGKRARAETEISRHTMSISHAAALLARDKVGDLHHTQVLVVGAGEMAELAAQALHMHGAGQFTCINRTYASAEALATQVNGRALNWYHLGDALAWADVVISATAAPHTVIYVNDVASILPRRHDRPLVFVDIAVPRDVEEAVGELPGVQRYDIDDLETALDVNLAQRQAAVPQVEAIVAQEVTVFYEWLQSRQVVPVIADLRRKAEALAQAEVEQALQKLTGLNAHDREVILRLAQRIVNKLLHEPTVRLKAQAASGNGHGYAHAIRELFVLGEIEPEDESERRAQTALRCDLQCLGPLSGDLS